MKSSSFVLAGVAAGLAITSMPQAVSADPPHCPPGLYKQGKCEQFPHFDGGFRIGDRLSRDRYRILDRDLYYDRYGRRLDDRYYYAEANGERLLIEAATGAIIDLLLR